MIYYFDQFKLDIARFELREHGAVQPLEPQVFTLLAYLVEHRERLVPKNELFDKLWEGRIVTNSTLTSRVKSARRAIGDNGKAQLLIKTIYGRGFRFVADVQVAQGAGLVPVGAEPDKADISIGTLPSPSIAELPLRMPVEWRHGHAPCNGPCRIQIGQTGKSSFQE